MITGNPVAPSSDKRWRIAPSAMRLMSVSSHTCVVSTGTACYIKGSGTLLAAMEEKLLSADGTVLDEVRRS